MKKLSFPRGLFALFTGGLLLLALVRTAEGYRDALVSARSAGALSQGILDYYQAELTIEHTISLVDSALLSGEDPLAIPGVRREENRLIVEAPLPDGRILRGEMTLTGPDSGGRYALTAYVLLPG